ncbi:hypothetical protein, partial [Streptomyces violascens]|uniref:hypothetical protein n=1 Tax=Streptomyces violascens TaxID=67381 RepID=UPI0036D1A6A5
MFGNAEILESAGPTETGDPEEILAEPPDTRDISAELSAPPRQQLPWLTLLLSGSLVAGLAFAGGALVEKNQSQGGTPSAAARGGAAQSGQGGQRQAVSETHIR